MINRLLAHLDPATVALSPGLAHAVVGYLRRHPRTRADDALALLWAAHVTDSGHSPVDDLVMIDPVHAVLWHLAVAGITWPPTDHVGEEILAVCDRLIRAHTVLDGRDGRATLIAGAYRGVQLHRMRRCAQGIHELQSAWISWHLRYGVDDSLVRRALTSVLDTDCSDVDPGYATTDHRQIAAWLDAEPRTAAPTTSTTSSALDETPATRYRGITMTPSWAGLPGLPAPPRHRRPPPRPAMPMDHHR